MNAFARRGACPAISAPMQTGDGLLARLNTVAGGLSPKALIGLCESALRHGSGIVEVTARGSVQIRGLTPRSAQALARDVDALEIEIRSGMPVETGPLAGMDAEEITDPRPLASEIRNAIARDGLAARLGPKVSVVVDGGGRLPMDAVLADVRLVASSSGWLLSTGGTAAGARRIGTVNDAQACAATIAILEAVAALGREARARDLADPHRIIAALPLSARPERSDPRTPSTGASIAMFPLADGTLALGIALPFGSMPAENIVALAQGAIALGVTEIRPAPSRTLLFPGLSLDACDTLRDAAASPGSPACTSGRIATRALAERIAAHDADLLDGSFTLHVSGCAKGCAHPAPAAITLVGHNLDAHDDGAGIALDATARSPEAAGTVISDAQAGAARIASLARRNRQSGETVAACLSRLGAATVTTAFMQGRE
jgi:precorrin-3B synthase